MNLHGLDLNLLVALNVLLKEKSVTQAADYLGITQPAMSNALKRLRTQFDDPLLVRTSEGMKATDRATALEPQVKELIMHIERVVQPVQEFDPVNSDKFFRIAVSDYAESTLIPDLLSYIRQAAPNISMDIMTPSDVTFNDVEQGHVDFVINRFDALPDSFHQSMLWKDAFVCMMAKDNPIADDFTLDNYIKARHVWVSKTGMGVGTGVNPDDVHRLGWVDETLAKYGKKRDIKVFTRHYQAAMSMIENQDLILTIPSRAARLRADNAKILLRKPPFQIPDLDLSMAWSALLHNNPAHRWFRRAVADVARQR
jgi:DNA-binding transcriptional LysR family regulator